MCTSTHILDLLHDRRRAAGRLLEQVAPARPQRLLRHPADVGSKLARHQRLALGMADQLAARDVELVLQAKRDGHRRDRLLELALVGVDRGDPRALAAGQHRHFVALAQRPAGELAGVATVVALPGRWTGG